MLIAADPVGSGFVVSLAHPGGNVTGMSSLTSDIGSKRVELLKEIVPDAKRVAVLWNSDNVSKVVEWKETQFMERIAFSNFKMPFWRSLSAGVHNRIQFAGKNRSFSLWSIPTFDPSAA